jgi:hypothetical protein
MHPDQSASTLCKWCGVGIKVSLNKWCGVGMKVSGFENSVKDLSLKYFH